ncbi:MAG TPA: tRNA pseudouridine(55) synthase TruB [Ramlibacter sp.]|uniref:tRNA pseudouridine(55) synthase TruB n=1 Tax=Ramlibacter sp. TaxID=1917967 RepID=UPI002CB5E75D|nr:tRNA pseudouridine(55) synthase TruB [Ramlibacter sp.]HVZ44959.1 tRNA pseudouridine(55) synthase TruB [Ramlibacter sp.]
MNAPRTRVQRRPVHGVLLLDKPKGLSSNDALQKAKWLLRAEKAGHTGTLDPLATGVLPLCFGAATKFSQLHLDADKAYEAVAKLGVTTTTGDAEGEIVSTRSVAAITPKQLAAVQQDFSGRMLQVPPMHSALKKNGRALYEYARAGIEVEREARQVEVFELDLRLEGTDALKITARVSKGTYIRTLAEDIGEALGCGAHLTSLRRVQTGPFGVAHCVTLDELADLTEEGRIACLLPVESLLADHERVTLGSEDAGRFLSGLRRRGAWDDAPRVAVFGPSPQPDPSLRSSQTGERPELPLPQAGDLPLPLAGEGWGEGCLLGTAQIKNRELIPGRLLAPTEIKQILETTT